MVDFSDLVTGALRSIGYAVVLIWVAVWHFPRKDVTSERSRCERSVRFRGAHSGRMFCASVSVVPSLSPSGTDSSEAIPLGVPHRTGFGLTRTMPGTLSRAYIQQE